MTDFEEIVPPTTFQLGVGYRALRNVDDHELTLSGQLTNPNDNAEQLNVGAEYVWNDLLAVRTGYAFGVEEASAPTFGFGLYAARRHRRHAPPRRLRLHPPRPPRRHAPHRRRRPPLGPGARGGGQWGPRLTPIALFFLLLDCSE